MQGFNPKVRFKAGLDAGLTRQIAGCGMLGFRIGYRKYGQHRVADEPEHFAPVIEHGAAHAVEKLIEDCEELAAAH